jgi:hypothetical protein
MWRLLVLACCCTFAVPAFAEPEVKPTTIALLPLDAEKRLEMYGQPVASAIASSLTSGNLKVVVVKENMTVPKEARLIVDGSIKAKGDTILLTIRIRDARDGTKIGDLLQASAPNVGAIDRAAAELSTRLLPAVRDELAKPEPPTVTGNGGHVVRDPKPVPPPEPMLLVAIGIAPDATGISEPLRAALTEAVGAWARANFRAPTTVEMSRLNKKVAQDTVNAAKAERAVAFEIVDYWIETEEVPIARARVRVRIADGSGITFDRIIATDSIVGDRNIPPPQFAMRVSREVLTILRPHMRRVEPKWR